MLKVITELEIQHLEWILGEVIDFTEDLDEEEGIELASDLREGLENAWHIIQGLRKRKSEDPQQLQQEYQEVNHEDDQGC